MPSPGLANINSWAKKTVTDSFYDYFMWKPEPSTEHILLDLLFPEERRTSSIMGGLQTSLGTQLWESLAKIIAESNGFTIRETSDVKMPRPIPQGLATIIDSWKNKREARGASITLDGFLEDLRTTIPEIPKNNIDYESLTKGEGIDLLIEKDGVEYAFDIKTVQINAGSGLKFNSTLMKWYAFRLFQNENCKFKAYMAFPYNPYGNGTWWEHSGAKAYPLLEDDVLVEDDFWGFLSGVPGTWGAIKEAFAELKEEGLGDLYRKAFKEPSKYFSALIFAETYNLELITSKDQRDFSTLRKDTKLEWKCKDCNEEFSESISRMGRLKKCPRCQRPY